MTPELSELLTSPWSPSAQTRRDRVEAGAVRRLAATLDVAAPDGVPPLWHWLAFLPEEPTAALGSDGHPARGGFLPPVRLERRMFAGGHFTFHQGIEIDEPLERRSEVADVIAKSGRSGDLVFVQVRHRLSSSRGLLVEETNDLVYRAQARAGTPAPARGQAPASGTTVVERTVHPTEAQLFRFSALTFNAHRIHYDLPYARDIEGYPSLVVQGPLLALWLAELLRSGPREHTPPVAAFSFRAVSPALLGDGIRLEAAHGEGGHVGLTAAVGQRIAMTAEARLV